MVNHELFLEGCPTSRHRAIHPNLVRTRHYRCPDAAVVVDVAVLQDGLLHCAAVERQQRLKLHVVIRLQFQNRRHPPPTLALRSGDRRAHHPHFTLILVLRLLLLFPPLGSRVVEDAAAAVATLDCVIHRLHLCLQNCV